MSCNYTIESPYGANFLNVKCNVIDNISEIIDSFVEVKAKFFTIYYLITSMISPIIKIFKIHRHQRSKHATSGQNSILILQFIICNVN